jgi:hypothetical protein
VLHLLLNVVDEYIGDIQQYSEKISVMKITGYIILFALIVLTSGCKHVVQYDCTFTPTYTENIKPILDVTCAREGCHSAGHGAGDINLSDYAGASDASKNKNFMGAIQHKPFYQQMPKGGDILPDTQIHLIYCWVQNGSPE